MRGTTTSCADTHHIIAVSKIASQETAKQVPLIIPTTDKGNTAEALRVNKSTNKELKPGFGHGFCCYKQFAADEVAFKRYTVKSISVLFSLFYLLCLIKR